MKILTFDETTSGIRTEGPILDFAEPRINLRDLIESKVLAGYERQLQIWQRKGLGKDEKRDQTVRSALEAFEKGQLIVLLPDRQAERLTETVTLSEGDEVTFLKLIPLIGG